MWAPTVCDICLSLPEPARASRRAAGDAPQRRVPRGLFSFERGGDTLGSGSIVPGGTRLLSLLITPGPRRARTDRLQVPPASGGRTAGTDASRASAGPPPSPGCPAHRFSDVERKALSGRIAKTRHGMEATPLCSRRSHARPARDPHDHAVDSRTARLDPAPRTHLACARGGPAPQQRPLLEDGRASAADRRGQSPDLALPAPRGGVALASRAVRPADPGSSRPFRRASPVRGGAGESLLVHAGPSAPSCPSASRSPPSAASQPSRSRTCHAIRCHAPGGHRVTRAPGRGRWRRAAPHPRAPPRARPAAPRPATDGDGGRAPGIRGRAGPAARPAARTRRRFKRRRRRQAMGACRRNEFPRVNVTPHSVTSSSDTMARAVLRAVLIVVAVVLALWVIYILRKPLTWIFIAAFITIALSGPINFLSRRMRRGLAVTMVYICLILTPFALIGLLVPPIVEQANNLVQNLPDYAQQVTQFVNDNDRLRQLQDDYDITG